MEMSDGQRITFLKEHKKFKSINEMASTLGIIPQNLYQIINGERGISKGVAEKIMGKIPELNQNWLKHGIGEPFASDDVPTTPLYDVVATCGYMENLSEGNPIGKISVPNMPKCDGAIHVTGDSMYPMLNNGDIVAYKVIHEMQMINYGEIHIVQYQMGDDRTICVKYVKRSEDDGKIRLVSYNKEFDDVEVDKKNVTYIAKVIFSVRRMSIV